DRLEPHNLYCYARSSPFSYLDPWGFQVASANQCLRYQVEFAKWYNKEKKKGLGWLAALPDCPCSIACTSVTRWRGVSIACYRIVFYEWEEIICTNPDPKVWNAPRSGAEVGIWHPGAETCIRSKPVKSGAGQQCCYDAKG